MNLNGLLMDKKVWWSAIFTFILMGIAMGACSSKKTGTGSSAYGTGDLSGRWDIVSLDGKEIKTDREAFLEFDVEKKRIHGNAGCNVINSVYEVNKTKNMEIVFKPAQMTMMACPDMEAENAFVRIYPDIMSFSFGKASDGKTTVSFLNANGREIMKLKKQ